MLREDGQLLETGGLFIYGTYTYLVLIPFFTVRNRCPFGWPADGLKIVAWRRLSSDRVVCTWIPDAVALTPTSIN